MKNFAIRFFLVFIPISLILSCQVEEPTNFIKINQGSRRPATNTATALNGGWLELKIKNDSQETTIYLASANAINYDVYENTGKKLRYNFALAEVVFENDSYVGISGIIRVNISEDNKASGFYEFEAMKQDPPFAYITNVSVEGKFADLPVGVVSTEGCQLAKKLVRYPNKYPSGDGYDNSLFIYGSTKKLVYIEEHRSSSFPEDTVFGSHRYFYKDGLVASPYYTMPLDTVTFDPVNNKIKTYGASVYEYEPLSGRLHNALKSGINSPGSKRTFQYDDAGNLTLCYDTAYTLTQRYRKLEYNTYDGHPNPFGLLAKSIGQPFLFYPDEGIVEVESLSANNVTNRVSSTIYAGAMQTPTVLNEQFTYEYNSAGFTTKTIVNNGERIITFEYQGCP